MMTEVISFINNIDTQILVLGFGIFACALSFSILLHSHKKTQKISQKLLRLERELQVAQGSAIGMGQQLILMEKQLNKNRAANKQSGDYREPQQKAHNTCSVDKNSSDDSIYDQARQALAKGLSIAEVAKQCGLSYAEVSLLESLSKSTISSC